MNQRDDQVMHAAFIQNHEKGLDQADVAVCRVRHDFELFEQCRQANSLPTFTAHGAVPRSAQQSAPGAAPFSARVRVVNQLSPRRTAQQSVARRAGLFRAVARRGPGSTVSALRRPSSGELPGSGRQQGGPVCAATSAAVSRGSIQQLKTLHCQLSALWKGLEERGKPREVYYLRTREPRLVRPFPAVAQSKPMRAAAGCPRTRD